jgi:hypothetical protein
MYASLTRTAALTLRANRLTHEALFVRASTPDSNRNDIDRRRPVWRLAGSRRRAGSAASETNAAITGAPESSPPCPIPMQTREATGKES